MTIIDLLPACRLIAVMMTALTPLVDGDSACRAPYTLT